MSLPSWVVWGFAATIVLTSLIAGSAGLGMTRVNMPYVLGTLVTPDRDRAKVIGVALHLLMGWLFALVYIAIFHVWGGPAWWKGALIGLAHAAFLLTVALPILPGIHPRMASESRGPTVMRQLEPPGFLALHYGIQTPISIVIGHVVFGLVLGVFYAPAG